MTLKEAFDYSFSFLNANGIDEPDFKALTVCCHIAGIRNSEYHFNKEKIISDKKLDDCLCRLKSGEPLQYIIGKWDFYDSEFYVGEGVLIPRPETEELVELAINNLKNVNNPIVIDLCSGTGCIGISIAKALTDSKVYCIEKSKKAYSYLLKNANGVDNVVPDQLGPTTLDPTARYDLIAKAFGGDNYYVTNYQEMKDTFATAVESGRPSIINVQIDPSMGKESGHIGNLNPSLNLKPLEEAEQEKIDKE